MEATLSFYPSLGKRSILVRHEVPGHITNRLQAALWQEACSLVQREVATVADIDAAISSGPGLRWALLGPLANQHLSGGLGGLAHTFEQRPSGRAGRQRPTGDAVVGEIRCAQADVLPVTSRSP